MSDWKNKPPAYWKSKLTPEEYAVCRLKGTEPPYSGKYYYFKGDGTYRCRGCHLILFRSSEKYDSGSGWPSFWDVIDTKNITLHKDNSLSMSRVELSCSRCGAHLGHVFDDGPQPTNKRYCINSLSLVFEKLPGSGDPDEGL